uniref:Uncharacterized protein n=1 Tax=Oryza sativa subsp. japonica TaxID=39947 RepID=Q75H67_ORYSJ|nr:hypothetical protein [Oryza sativa Japonica Group]
MAHGGGRERRRQPRAKAAAAAIRGRGRRIWRRAAGGEQAAAAGDSGGGARPLPSLPMQIRGGAFSQRRLFYARGTQCFASAAGSFRLGGSSSGPATAGSMTAASGSATRGDVEVVAAGRRPGRRIGLPGVRHYASWLRQLAGIGVVRIVPRSPEILVGNMDDTDVFDAPATQLWSLFVVEEFCSSVLVV